LHAVRFRGDLPNVRIVKETGDPASDPASASVGTRSLRLGSVIPVAVLAGLLIVGLLTRHGASHPSAVPSGVSASASGEPTPVTAQAGPAVRTYDARGVFLHYPASWRVLVPSPVAGLVPRGSSWSVAFRDDSGDLIEVAAYPSLYSDAVPSRFEVANAAAREMAGPSASVERTAIKVRAPYPSFGYPLDSIHPPGVGFVVFTPESQFAIGCSAAASLASGETRCRYVLDSFRDTSAGVSVATPTVRSAADAVYKAWQAGTLPEVGAFATQGVLRSLIDSPWKPGSALASCNPVPGSNDTFACTVTEWGKAGKLFVVTPIGGRFKVVAVGECSGDVTHGTCYTLRTRNGAFP
jgi:hypothetical protein